MACTVLRKFDKKFSLLSAVHTKQQTDAVCWLTFCFVTVVCTVFVVKMVDSETCANSHW